MKPVDVKNKFKVGDHIRISKYKNTFAKRYSPNWSEKILVIKKVKNTVPWTYVINDLNGDDIIGTFYEKWKDYDNSFNNWIDKTDLIK